MTSQIPINQIFMQDRMRFDQGSLDSLKASMHERGLLQGIGIQPVDNGGDIPTYRVLWGGRRLAAALELGWTQIEAKIAPGLQDYEASELEFMENWERKSMTWQEEVMGLNRIHSQRVRKGALQGEAWGQRETGRLLGISVGNVNYTLKVAKLLEDGDQEIGQCPNMAEALRLMMRRKDAEIIKAGGTPAPRKPEEMFFKKEDIDRLNQAPKVPEVPWPQTREYTIHRVVDSTAFEVANAGIVGFAIKGCYETASWILDRESEYETGMKQMHLVGGLVFRDLSRTEGQAFIQASLVPFQFYYNSDANFEVHNTAPFYADSTALEKILYGPHALADGFWRWFFDAVKGSYSCVFWAMPRSIEGVCFTLRHQIKTYATLSNEQLAAVTKEMSKYGSIQCINTGV
jgi:ParB family transcriptional regulator, chromosome partitioning protein